MESTGPTTLAPKRTSGSTITGNVCELAGEGIDKALTSGAGEPITEAPRTTVVREICETVTHAAGVAVISNIVGGLFEGL